MTAPKASPKPKAATPATRKKAPAPVQAALPFDETQRRLLDRAIVRPPTYNTAGTVYTPPANIYQRNSGHTHIASHGVQC